MTHPSTARLFIALLPDDSVRNKLVAWRDAWTWPRSAAPVSTAKLHMTLHFLGDVALDRLPELQDALEVCFDPFTLMLAHATLWPNGIAVLEPETVPAALTALHEATATVLRRLGLPVDARQHRPHVTLARRAAGASLQRQAVPVSWHIAGYALMSSALGSAGGYTQLRQY